jgi:hypothetical protein
MFGLGFIFLRYINMDSLPVALLFEIIDYAGLGQVLVFEVTTKKL